MLKQIILNLALAQAIFAAPSNNTRIIAADDKCNGFTELCDRKYSDITFTAAHNAAFVGKTPAHNQFEYPEQGMDMGIRYFTTQTHIENGEIRQCHSDCALLDVGPFSEILVSLTKWLSAHPREVVTLLIGNGDDAIRIEEFAEIFEAEKAVDMIYVPKKRMGLDEWPTLGEIIEGAKRLIVFMDYNSDTSKVPYILPQYDYYVETPFSPTKDNFYNCDIDRPDRDNADDRMIFANHNLNVDLFGVILPDQNAAENTNSLESIMKQSNICVDKWSKVPNVVMLDFVTKGQVIEAQRKLNNL